jgi:hypothetical protein
MGWSWRELQETPVDVVVALVETLNERAKGAAAEPAAQAVTRPRGRRR